MPSIERTVTADKVQDADGLLLELRRDAAGIGAECTGVAVYPADPAPGSDRLWLEFDAEPDVAAVDVVIAAHPAISPGVTGTFAVSKNTDYKIFELPLAPGEHVALDIHVHAALGDASSADSVFLDYYAAAWRNTAGNVRVAQPVGSRSGNIPGFDVVAAGTETTVVVEIRMQKSGTITLFHNMVKVESRGVL